MLPLNTERKKSVEEFCWGELDITIDSQTRIVLRKAILDTLKKHNVSKLWRFPSFDFRGLILCPPQNKDLYVETVRNILVNIEPPEHFDIAHRKYISPGLDASFDKQGRITLTQTCIKHANIKPGDSMTILGRGPWYEVWHTNDLYEMIQIANLKTDQIAVALSKRI